MPQSYRKLQLYAIAISVISVIYNGAEGAISIAFGAESSSKSLVFFGIQSGIEVASDAIVLWRFRNVAKPGEERGVKLDPRHLRFEKKATFIIGVLLILLGLATIGTAISILALHEAPETSNASLIISGSALLIMIFIWLPKRYLARQLNSSTMQGEATCSLSCIQITIVLFIGSLIYRVWRGGWWIDGATSIILGILFGWEGVKMVRWARDPEFDGGCCSSCRVPEIGIEEGKKGKEKTDDTDSCHDECCSSSPVPDVPKITVKDEADSCKKGKGCCSSRKEGSVEEEKNNCGKGCCSAPDMSKVEDKGESSSCECCSVKSE
ncbi:hypothetical protein Clacol_004425 [Clathrus columnatus]|uniref:Cation efflux protein transmembrane domain-containing protein n=1 Tax=Clathrus columnatus TaxID=1419009 RepID=A0AAV5A6E4_9AGAM|nr:hypothetical protein Clacol_004425 [Clathrus columnatus]